MREPYSLEAEHGVLGAMMIRPELIDLLTADLRAEDYYFGDNAEVHRAIVSLQSDNQPVDFLTVAERI